VSLGSSLFGPLSEAAKKGAPALTFWQARLLLASVLPLKRLTPQEALNRVRFIQKQSHAAVYHTAGASWNTWMTSEKVTL